MKVGLTLPQFRHDAGAALATAGAAERSGIDGVFVFDHLWPPGRPDRPALAPFPLLGALAAETGRIVLGTLVARVRLLPDAVLVHNFATLQRMVGSSRLVAGLGTGDRVSRAENESYGIPFPPAAERRAAVAECCRGLRSLGITAWVAGVSPALQEIARAGADAHVVWGLQPAAVAALAGAGGPEVAWGGQVPADPAAVAETLLALRDAGAAWAICAPPYGEDPLEAVDRVAEARRALG